MVSGTTRAAAGELDSVEWGARELHWLRNVSQPVGTYAAAVRRERSEWALREGRVGDRAGGLPWTRLAVRRVDSEARA